jgi:hypothetical protein
LPNDRNRPIASTAPGWGAMRVCGRETTPRDVDAMKTKAGIERAVVDVLRKLGFLEGAPKGRPPLRIVKKEAKN